MDPPVVSQRRKDQRHWIYHLTENNGVSLICLDCQQASAECDSPPSHTTLQQMMVTLCVSIYDEG